MTTVGLAVQELSVRDESGADRVCYVAKFEEAVSVLRAGEKRSQKTARADLVGCGKTISVGEYFNKPPV